MSLVLNDKDKMSPRLAEYINQLQMGNHAVLARLITLVENQPVAMAKILPSIQSELGKAYCVGLTGPPGAGKSSLLSKIAKLFLEQGYKVGIIAVDPSSPFTGGAFLGDRIRMQELGLDPGVFIRSMATRGSLGGLARSTKDVIKLMDACGFDYILVETVGVGQTELDVMQTTDMTVVVLVPEGGDSVQAMKAGLMEIGDVFVVNKSDRPNADNVVAQVKSVLEMNPKYQSGLPPVLMTQGTVGNGVAELVDTVQVQLKSMNRGDLEVRRRERRLVELEDTMKWLVIEQWRDLTSSNQKFKQIQLDVLTGVKDPYSAASEAFSNGFFA